MPHPSPASYDVVASEYYDPLRHPTCRNFRSLSRTWLADVLPRDAQAALCLEVGAGASLLAPLLQARGVPLAGLALQDASAAMLLHARRWCEAGAVAAVAAAHDTGRPDHGTALLVASLADPYNTPAFWREAARILHPHGEALVTLPSHDWALRFRRGESLAEFTLLDGRAVALPSHVPPLPAQIALLEQAGLRLVRFDALGIESLPAGEPVSPKLQVFGSQPRTSVVWGLKVVPA